MEAKTTLGNGSSLSKVTRRQHLLDALKKCTGTLEEFAAEHGLSRKTLYNLRKKKVESPEDLLDARHFGKGRQARRDDRVMAHALAYKEIHPKAAIRQIHLHLKETFDSSNLPIPSYGQLKHSFRNEYRELIDMIERGGKAWFQESAITVRRSTQHLNKEWQIDATQLDTWALSMRTMQLYRPWLLSAIDSASRVVMAAMVLDREPTSRDGLLLLRKAILPKNAPEAPYFGKVVSLVPDNHQIWKSDTFLNAMLLADIHIEPVPSEAPQAKGKKERWFRTIKEQLCANLVGYTNQSGGLAKAKQRAIPGPLLQGLVDKYLACYHSTYHEGIGISPWELWHQLLDSAEGLLFDAKLLAAAFKVVAVVEVQRDGIRTPEGHHLNAAALTPLVGEKLTLKIPLDGYADGVEAFYKGEPIAGLQIIEGNEVLAKEIAASRLEQVVKLRKIRKTLRKALKLAPPVTTDAVDVKKQREQAKPPQSSPAEEEGGNIPELGTEEE